MESDIFRSAVTSVLNNWTALQLAVEHGMGTRENAQSLVDYVIETFVANDDISCEEMADVLSEVMDSLFQTVCEDNSPDEVGALLWRFYQHHRVGETDKIKELLSKLPPCQLWLCKQLDTSAPVKMRNLQPLPETMDAEESEWTEVKSRRSKRTLNSAADEIDHSASHMGDVIGVSGDQEEMCT
ncbi:uncharacterized protein LOC126484460 [Schistocerca serialis cubense]|uniref:uncharacterized protein LOC126484460 n=1 Tax=Schistocerca serialis cubense TaxID=2023355 RepID=UPI00214E88C5|nr:uncharacterized protein LOC126484460 [Schistocerca serialis cubense]